MRAKDKAPKEDPKELVVNALRIRQSDTELYGFFVPGGVISQIADISRVTRDQRGKLHGFQRKEIQDHVRSIVSYLDHDNVVFPNAIIVAFSPDVHFKQSRGPKPVAAIGDAQAGYLHIPLHSEGERVAWIVDGQQRSLALSRTKNQQLAVPVIGFVSDNIEMQREQFILVNKAKPLPRRLIDELLPETNGVLLPRDLNARRLPSVLCDALNRQSESPFFRLIKRPSDDNPQAVVTDAAVIRMIQERIQNPLGALMHFRDPGTKRTNHAEMYRVLAAYWTAVKETFPEAWALPPSKSRLMHSVGIVSLGTLMDKILAKVGTGPDIQQSAATELRKIAPFCAWTVGVWPIIDAPWNQIEYTAKWVRAFSDVLVRLYISKANDEVHLR